MLCGNLKLIDRHIEQNDNAWHRDISVQFWNIPAISYSLYGPRFWHYLYSFVG